MAFPFFKYQGAGNDFVLIDNRAGLLPICNPDLYALWCHRQFGIGADGLILIQSPCQSHLDFEMLYYNADGHIGSMCGNGGRCAVAFAHHLGIIDNKTCFLAADGEHEAVLNKEDGTVHLKMQDVAHIEPYQGDWILNTGSPHYIRFVDTLEGLDVNKEGAAIRNSPRFVQHGINVNFVQSIDNQLLKIATFERGVEAETLACGTGVVAASIAAHYKDISKTLDSPASIQVIAKGGILQTHFTAANQPDGTILYHNVWLIGKAEKVFEGVI